MRGRLARLVWILGLLLLYRRLRPRHSPFETPPAARDPRAEELRRKLDESRSIVAERERFESAETPVDRASRGGDLEDRRREIHERGNAAIDQMRGARAPGQPPLPPG